MLTSYASLEALDKYLKNKIDKDLKPHSKLKHIDSDRLKNRLQKFSFKEGFKKKNFVNLQQKISKQYLSLGKNYEKKNFAKI